MSGYTSQPRLLLGPLTETFTQPTTCLQAAAVSCTTCLSNSNAWLGQSCSATNSMADATDCWPPRSGSPAVPTAPFFGWGFYSPGIVCPAGHTAACSATANGNQQWPVQFSLTAGETAVGCCPIGYTCTNHFGNTCSRIITRGAVSIQTCLASGVMAQATPLTVPTTQTLQVDSTAVTAFTADFTYYAPMFQLNFQSTDLPARTSSVATISGSSSTVSTSSTGGPTGLSSGDDSGSLPTGVKVALGVGITLGIVGMVLALGFFICWRRSRSRSMMQPNQQGNVVYWNTSNGPQAHRGWKQLDVQTPSEMDGHVHYEMAVETRYEMPAQKWST